MASLCLLSSRTSTNLSQSFLRSSGSSRPPKPHMTDQQRTRRYASSGRIVLSSTQGFSAAARRLSTLTMTIESFASMTFLMLRMFQSKRSTTAPELGGGCFSHLSNSGFSTSTSAERFAEISGRRSSQACTIGSQPRSLALTKMIPARDTVAGDALRRSWTSKTILQLSVIGMRSLLASVRILLSSSTVFRFSIQMASTGPSHTIHVVLFRLRLLYFCQIEAKTPGVHSSLTGSLTPYICESVIAFGFMTTRLCGAPSFVRQFVRTCAISVLPHSVGPTSMKPWRTSEVSYSWMTLVFQVSHSQSRPFLTRAATPCSMFL
mmetsp:Transcript_37397/g.96688  ORF Transcript_37397/g.96688 Transcript_37397/m.96688 type:complete len:320 (+) Transcript_37397:5238-6197(+)